jgi:hypothetical protein
MRAQVHAGSANFKLDHDQQQLVMVHSLDHLLSAPCVNACNLRQKSTEQAERKYRDIIVYAESNGDSFRLVRSLVVGL